MPATLLSLLELPGVPHRVFERSPLALSVCQVKFPRELSIANDSFVAPFHHAIKARYPLADKLPELGLAVSLGASSPQVQQESGSFRWQFADSERRWTVTLLQEAVSIETRAYASFADFLLRLDEVVKALIDHVAPTAVTRLGLRYINEIRLKEMAWEEAITAAILGPITLPQFAPGVMQSVQEILLRYEDGHGVNIRHGLLPDGSTVLPKPGEELPRGSFYLLDFDAFREFPVPGGLATDVDIVRSYVDTFNKVIYQLFRMSTTEDYISTLGEYSNGDN